MTLDVERPDGSGYRVSDRWMVAGDEPVSVGSELRVLVDPRKHDRIAIDWEATRELYRRKTEERRKLLTVGVPVPVTKIRDAAEETRGPAVSLTRGAGRDEEQERPEGSRRSSPVTEAERPRPGPGPSVEERPANDRLLTRLERVTALHDAGALTDGEFEAVKRHLLA